MKSLLKVSSAIACATGLVGCGGKLDGAITPAPPPTAAEVAIDGEALRTAWSQLRVEAVAFPPLSPAAASDPELQTVQYFVMVGYNRGVMSCGNYFNQNRRLRSETSFAKDTLVSLGTAAGTIAGLAGATAVLGTTGIVPLAVDNFNKTFLNADIADAIEPKVRTGMGDYRTANPVGTATAANAIDRVREHAQLCTIGNMLDIAKTALNNIGVGATSSDAPPSGGESPTGGGAPFASTFALPPAATGGTSPGAPTAGARRTIPSSPVSLGRNGSYYYYSVR
jgi:hypothetical protein